jgi:hypothetical protein
LVNHAHYLYETGTLCKKLKELVSNEGDNKTRAVGKFFMGKTTRRIFIRPYPQCLSDIPNASTRGNGERLLHEVIEVWNDGSFIESRLPREPGTFAAPDDTPKVRGGDKAIKSRSKGKRMEEKR